MKLSRFYENKIFEKGHRTILIKITFLNQLTVSFRMIHFVSYMDEMTLRRTVNYMPLPPPPNAWRVTRGPSGRRVNQHRKNVTVA